MPDDVLNTEVIVPPAAPAAPGRTTKVTCEFCGCQLTHSGEIIRMGDEAKRFRQHDEKLEAKDKEIRILNEEILALKRERDALKGTGGASRSVGQRVS